MANRFGNVLILSGVESVDERLVVNVIQADTTGVLYQKIGGQDKELWTPNAVGDRLDLGGMMVEGLATTGAGDAFQVFLK